MSNARNLANLLGTSTTVPSLKQPAGSVLQCVTTNYPDDFQFSLSGTTGNNGKLEVVTGLNCSITPTSTSSRILYQATVYLGFAHAYDIGIHIIKNATSTTSSTQTNYTDTSPCGGSYLTDANGNALRGQTSNSTPKGTGVFNNYNTSVTPNYEIQPVSMSLLDHPNTTSQITYNFAVGFYLWQSYSLFMNRSYGNQQGNYYDTNPVSTVTLMEIA